ncbi:MAG: alanyl-tRNA editing protein, partial [Gammaproteobacteria bacterium]
MTKELFGEDAYLRATEAKIDSTIDGSIVLDQTVFYPKGGGQPGDRGVLTCSNGAQITIVDTRKHSNGSILHVPADGEELLPPGTTVHVKVDWDYRYRHMRTHTCLHLLCSLIPYPVTGGSISQDKGRLDFDMTETI